MNRRGFLGGLLAGAALATGLARTRLELVDDPRDYHRGLTRIVNDWWQSPPYLTHIGDRALPDAEIKAAMERAWKACVDAQNEAPQFIWVSDQTLEEFRA